MRCRSKTNSTEILCNALLGLHAATGCDTVSSFSGKGKVKALKLMMAEDEYARLFYDIGNSWSIDDAMKKKFEKFVCHLYGYQYSDINTLRYKVYCVKNGKVDGDQLPPCRDSLEQHLFRANYQTRIWKLSLTARPVIPSPDDHGWYFIENEVAIKWNLCKPAPDEILELLSCKCRKKCVTEKCVCVDNGLKCTDACSLDDCENMEQVENDMVYTDDDEQSGESDDDDREY